MRPGRYILNSEWHPIPATDEEYLDWHRGLTGVEKTGIGFTVARETRNDVTVSTAYLGFDHAWTGEPQLWETMVFGGPDDEWTDRYTSQADAVAGHAAACKRFFA
jgi:hypothetical protein